MTIFHIIALVVYILTVEAISKLFHWETAPVAAIVAIVWVTAWAVWASALARRARMQFPKCHNPDCKDRHYRAIASAKKIKVADTGLVFVCKTCGQKYVFSKNRFMILDVNNRTISYVKRPSRHAEWEVDDKAND